jgi:hypothetical protein
MRADKLNRALIEASSEAGQATLHAAVTIAARWPILAGCLIAPTAAGLAEWNRAAAEKTAAAWEGAFAASAAWQQLMIRSAFTPPSPTALAYGLLGVSRTAGRSARKRVKANARRLTRRSMSG